MHIQFDKFSMAYTDQGAGQPILLIHGYPLSRQMWEPQVQELSTVARVLAPDLRGFGDSTPTAGNYPMDLLAGDCLTFLDQLGITEPVVVCGLSMGGYIAMAFQRKYPDRMTGLILAATRSGADSPAGKASRDAAVKQVTAEGPKSIARSMLPKLLAPATYETQPDLVDRLRTILESASAPGIKGALLGMRDRPDSTPQLADTAVPALIFHGAEDQLFPDAEARAMHSLIPNSTLAILPASGHMLNMEQPALFNQAVRKYLQSL